MVRKRTAAVVAAGAVALVGCAADAPGEPEPPRAVPAEAQRLVVVSHTDGDTLRVRLAEDGVAGRRGREVAVRLLEIDAPEQGRPGQVEECYADEASQALARMLPLGAEVWGEADRELRDRYGRTLLYLYVGRNGEAVLVNHRLVAQGYAVAVLFRPNDRHIDLMRRAETRATASGRGLWGACPHPPGAPG